MKKRLFLILLSFFVFFHYTTSYSIFPGIRHVIQRAKYALPWNKKLLDKVQHWHSEGSTVEKKFLEALDARSALYEKSVESYIMQNHPNIYEKIKKNQNKVSALEKATQKLSSSYFSQTNTCQNFVQKDLFDYLSRKIKEKKLQMPISLHFSDTLEDIAVSAPQVIKTATQSEILQHTIILNQNYAAQCALHDAQSILDHELQHILNKDYAKTSTFTHIIYKAFQEKHPQCQKEIEGVLKPALHEREYQADQIPVLASLEKATIAKRWFLYNSLFSRPKEFFTHTLTHPSDFKRYCALRTIERHLKAEEYLKTIQKQ